MTNKIQMDLSVRDAQMVAAWKRSTQSVSAFNQELDKIGQKQRQNRQHSGQFFKGMTTNLASVAAGYVSVTGAAALLINANRDILQQTEEVGKKFDELFRKFRIQAGLRGLDADNAQAKILEIAERQAVTSEQASGAATQLVSSGFSSQEASGESLEEFLRILNASNASGKDVDSAGLAKAIASYLDAQGLDKNSKNVALVGRSVQALFKNTNLQLADLQDLAKVSSVFAGKLSVKEQLGAYSTLVDSMPASEAKTGLRNFVLQSATASAQKEKVKSLDTIGLKPTDIDFVGENLDQVLDRLATGLAKLPVEEQLPVLTKIYEKENAAVVQSLINKRQKVTSSYAVQSDTAQFEADVEEATSGRNAAERRAAVRAERRRAEKDDEGDLLKKELDALAETQGVSPFRRSLFSGGYDTLRFLGIDKDTAGSIAYGSPTDYVDPSQLANESLEKRKSPGSEYGKGELPPPPPPAPSRNTVTFKQLEDLGKGLKTIPLKSPGPPTEEQPGFWDRFVNSPTVRRFTGSTDPPIRKSEIRFGNTDDQSPEPFSRFGAFPAETANLTQALKENTEAIKSQANKPGAAKQPPVKVEVTVSSDTATAPNGPRPSASLARPIK
tara:strand:- start:14402 stop:16240 length:1839 start_codon:yes stop_codon:yes gene_type:complete